MTAATAAPVLSHAGSAADADADADDLIVKCASFVAIDIRIARLVSRWSDLETEAFEIPGWHKLSPEEQLARPQGQQMADIDRMLLPLFDQRRALLAALPDVVATDPTGVAAKVAVAAKAIDPEDDPEVHALVSGAARELANMRCPDCHRPLVLETWIDWSIRSGRGRNG